MTWSQKCIPVLWIPFRGRLPGNTSHSVTHVPALEAANFRMSLWCPPASCAAVPTGPGSA